MGWVGSGDGDGRRGFKTTKISPAKTNRWLGNSLRVAVKGEMQYVHTYVTLDRTCCGSTIL